MIINSVSSPSPLPGGWGRDLKFQALIMARSFWCPSRVTLLEQKTFLSPGNSKGFVSGSGVKDEILEQRMLLVLLSLKKL